MAKKAPGWYNGFSIDIDLYETGGAVWFRVWEEGYFSGCRAYHQQTLGL